MNGKLAMIIEQKERLELLKLEMGLIQNTLDKYDDIIFRSRNWFITLWMGAVGLSVSVSSKDLPWLAVFISIVYWLIEGTMRHQYWYKYVIRYRAIREYMNEPHEVSFVLSVYDLTHHYGARGSQLMKLRKSFLKIEPALLYILMALGAVIVRELIAHGVIVSQ